MTDSTPPAPGASQSEIGVYTRLGQAETRIETTRTEVVALTSAVKTAIEDLNKNFGQFRMEFLEFQRGAKPQYLGMFGLMVTGAVAIAALVASFLNARISPIEHDILSAERVNTTKHMEIDRRILEEVDRNEKRHVGQQAQTAAMLEKLLETRERIAYNNARIEEIQRVMFHSPPAQGQPVVAQPRAGNAP